ncbi:putative conjugative transfer factor, TraB [Parvularcula bermudensis HTCC2503]|uniref:Putative conjugative transfer factor, TraB n=1 Tax=Parvularcula bermudensis (strain ATCC BAA-594 / HTCC2503 / KCTC 12087) TaxID=314260 RepID=E0TB13_PARBH|nr:TraB/VirB10 family protein [Parvularcula bermudensis]ADM08222.1 putative conjugative transfer factor, TraB [Parvularcula bermudensis HTCC2503]
MSEENKKRLTRQRLLMYGAGAAAVAAASVWIFSGDGADNQTRAEDLRRRKAMTDVINPPGMADDFLSETGTRLAAVEGAISRLEADNTSLKEALRSRDLELAATRADLQKTRDDAAAMVEDMAGRVASVSTRTEPALGLPTSEPSAIGDPFGRRGVLPSGAAPQPLSVEPVIPRTVQVLQFAAATEALDTRVLEPAVFRLDEGDYVPPNAYAPAHVLVGVDMSTGVRLSADPKPVLLRITGPARSVLQNGRQLDVDLTGCLVNGAAHAELSSERVYVKLQKITCDRGDGEVAESPVEGYIAQLGKVGVRGRVVSREGDIVSKALVAGVVGGFGRGIARNTDQIFAAGTAGGSTIIGQDNLSAGEIAAGGFGEGLATAADTVSDYLIDRAEQYQPVIEMPTGIDVEIVFLSGFYARGTQ